MTLETSPITAGELRAFLESVPQDAALLMFLGNRVTLLGSAALREGPTEIHLRFQIVKPPYIELAPIA